MTQSEALSILKMGNNVFLTGSAGSGKTYVLNNYIRYLRDHGVAVAVTASTGIAATHMQGVTIHAWSGIGIKTFMDDRDIDQLEQKSYVYKRFEKTRVLVIDEISMLSGEFLDMLDRVCRAMKRKDIPFGGMQVILCGDLFQLPPIAKNGTPNLVIDSNAWKTMGLVVCYLSEQHRQDDDDFTGILNAIRDGTIDDTHYELLQNRMCNDASHLGDITTLFTHNVDVDAINSKKLAAIDDDEHTFTMHTRGRESLVESLKKSCLALETLLLKRGAEVMFIKNNPDAGYVNGTRGTVVDFAANHMPIVQTTQGKRIAVDTAEWVIDDDGKVKASITQLPIRHAWAITVHKSQGMSLDAAVMDLSKSFVPGMGYVALSRVRRLSGVHLLGINNQALCVDPRVRIADTLLRTQSQKASQSLAQLTEPEITLVANDFIMKSGGTLDTNSRPKQKSVKLPTHEITYQLIAGGKTILEAAADRDFTIGTIIGHLETCKAQGMDVRLPHITLAPGDMQAIAQAFKKAGDQKLTSVKNLLDKAGKEYDFETIRVGRLFLD